MSSSSSSAAFDPSLRAALLAMVRKRVPESEVEDIVQSTLAEAIESPHAPTERESLRKWIFGVAKNKVVDYHRRAGRESFELPEVAGSPAPHDEADLLRWATRHLPDGDEAQKTLGWMLREGDGEKLESIAASEKLPAPRVRQRVSRLRRHLKTHWARELAMLAAVGIAVTALVLWLKRDHGTEPIAHDPNAAPIDPRAADLRKAALERCAASDWARCVEGLDAAKKLDPAGDARPEVQSARAAAGKALQLAPPEPSPAPSGAPTTEPPVPPAPAPTSKMDDESKTKMNATDVSSPAPSALSSSIPWGGTTKPQGHAKKAAKPPAKPAPKRADKAWSGSSLAPPSPTPAPTPTPPPAQPAPANQATPQIQAPMPQTAEPATTSAPQPAKPQRSKKGSFTK